jgi:O-antigen/teichoic acid export membrane protein
MTDKTISTPIVAALWSFVQRIGGIAISFISNIILARLLFPEDFGTIGLIVVFSSLADTLVDAGLGSALIQKNKVTKQDLSTVFTTNIVFSIILFTIIFIAAPFISDYVGVEGFDIYLRVQVLTILLRALYVVEFSLLNRELRFKDLAKINVISSFFSVIVAVIFAYRGYGVWSLIIKNISLQLILVFLYKYFIKVSVSLNFNKKSFWELFNFGGYVSLTYLLDFIFSNIVTLLLGKRYSVKDLGYYTQANSLRQIPINTLSLVVGQVMFPFFSKFQNDNQRVIDSMRKTVLLISFSIFPILLFLVLFAEPIIVLLFSDKWLPSAKIFQILCFSGLVNALIHANRSVLKSLGYSKIIFLAQVISIIIGFTLLVIGLNYSLTTLLIFIVINSYFNFLILAIFVHLKIGYKLWSQIKDLLLNLFLSVLVMYTVSMLSKFIVMNNFFYITINLLIFTSIYLASHFILNTSSFVLIKNMFLKKK